MNQTNKQFNINKILPVLAVLSIFGFIAFVYLTHDNVFTVPNVSAGAAHNVTGYAYSPNTGIISFNCTNTNTCTGAGGVDYGVNIDPTTGNFSGYAHSPHLGWLSFDISQTGPIPLSGSLARLNLTGPNAGKVTGWGRFLAGKDPQAGGWDGWVQFSDDTNPNWVGGGVKIDITTGPNRGKFSGYAWGRNGVVGWIDTANTGGNPGKELKVTLTPPILPPCTVPPAVPIIPCTPPPPTCTNPVTVTPCTPPPLTCTNPVTVTPCTQLPPCTATLITNCTPPPPCTATLITNCTPPPGGGGATGEIIEFRASRQRIRADTINNTLTEITLSWKTNNVSSCVISGLGVPNIIIANTELSSSSQKVLVSKKSTFTMTCQRSSGPPVSRNIVVDTGPAFKEF